MQNYVIFTDTAADFNVDLLDLEDVEIFPMKLFVGEETYTHSLGEDTVDLKSFYQGIRGGNLPTTTMISAAEYMDRWEPILKEGKDIISISLSSHISGAYEQSVLAAEKLMEKYPVRKIYTIDSKGATGCQGILFSEAIKLREKKYPVDIVAEQLAEMVQQVVGCALVDDLFHLNRGGRLSKVSAVMGSALRIKPIITFNQKGDLVLCEKVRGWRRGMDKVITNFNNSYTRGPVYLAHSDCLEEVEKFKELLLENTMVEEVSIGDLSPIIGSHVGADAFTISYFGSRTDKD